MAKKKGEDVAVWVVIIGVVGWIAYGLLSDTSVTTFQDVDGNDISDSGGGVASGAADFLNSTIAAGTTIFGQVFSGNYDSSGDPLDNDGIPIPLTSVRPN